MGRARGQRRQQFSWIVRRQYADEVGRWQVVTEAVNAPSGGAQAPPGGVAMQFPASSDASADEGAEEEQDDEKELTDEEKAIKEEKEKEERLHRELDRTKARTYRCVCTYVYIYT